MTRPKYTAESEPPTPRLCVCECPARCMAAVVARIGFVYRTETPRRTVAPVGVYDKIITGERWVVPPVRMVLVGRISAEACAEICGPSVEYLNTHGKVSHAERCRQLERATRVLSRTNPEWTLRHDAVFAASAAKYLAARGYGP